MRDVGTHADRLASVWADRIRRNREQAGRLCEVPGDPEPYGAIRGEFRADPRRSGDPILDSLLALARPHDTWLDIGAGAGRYALPIALRVRHVIAVEPSDGMRAVLAELMTTEGISNIEVLPVQWPPSPGSPAEGVHADVAVIAGVGYDIEAIDPFLDTMEAGTGRLCVALLMECRPSGIADQFWPEIYGEERVTQPGLNEFVELLRARGKQPTLSRIARQPRGYASFDDLLCYVRVQLQIARDGVREHRLAQLLRREAIEGDGRWYLDRKPPTVGRVTWAPSCLSCEPIA